MGDIADLLQWLPSTSSFDLSFYLDATTTQHLLMRDDAAWSRLALELRLALESAQAEGGGPASVAALTRHAYYLIECQPAVFGPVEGRLTPDFIVEPQDRGGNHHAFVAYGGRHSIHGPPSMASGTGINLHCRRIACSA